MQLRRFETPGLAHYAYLLGDAGVAAIVDPRREIDEYLAAARELGVRIEFVIETHRQEDFVLGSAQLAARIGARIVNGRHECFGRGDLRLAHGEDFLLGRLRVRALHTPGHTPESMCYAVHLPDAERAWAVFTGDTLLFGDSGRTDLPAADRVGENAGLLFDSVHRELAPLADEALVFPAHGPGSVCGTKLADRPLSTLGLERRSNAVFTLERDAFVARREADRLPRPPYFRDMELVNLEGGLPPARRRGEVPLLGADELATLLGSDDALLIDTREPEAFASGHIPGAYSIWMDGLVPFAGWIASPGSTLYLCTNDDDEVDDAVARLATIGLDEIRGALRGGHGRWRTSGLELVRDMTIVPRELAQNLDDLWVLDVREVHEFESGHIPEARHVYVGELEREVDSLPFDRHRPIAVTCSVGHRASLAASVLSRAGFSEVRNLLGGMRAWEAAGLETSS